MLSILFALLAPTLALPAPAAPDLAPLPAAAETIATSPAAAAAGPARAGVAFASDTARTVYAVAPQENEARYRVREQLARLNFPNDAVGTTSGVTGQLALAADGTIDRDASSFVIDLTTLTTDSDRRDNFLRRNTLQTADHPTMTLAPTSFADLPHPLPESGEVNFTMEGDFIFKGERHPTLWDVTASFDNGEIRGLARTVLTFEQIGLEKPRVGSVLSVADEIRLEYDFFLVNRSATSR